jgi:hypothetical protein
MSVPSTAMLTSESAAGAPCVATATARDAGNAVQAAADRLYDAECAVHAARQAGVDAWVAAASDTLHRAIEHHLRLAANAS